MQLVYHDVGIVSLRLFMQTRRGSVWISVCRCPRSSLQPCRSWLPINWSSTWSSCLRKSPAVSLGVWLVGVAAYKLVQYLVQLPEEKPSSGCVVSGCGKLGCAWLICVNQEGVSGMNLWPSFSMYYWECSALYTRRHADYLLARCRFFQAASAPCLIVCPLQHPRSYRQATAALQVLNPFHSHRSSVTQRLCGESE